MFVIALMPPSVLSKIRHDRRKRLVFTSHSLVDTVRLLRNHIGMKFRMQLCGVCQKKKILGKYRYENTISALNLRALPVRRCREGFASQS